jgi:hypothetical protein
MAPPLDSSFVTMPERGSAVVLRSGGHRQAYPDNSGSDALVEDHGRERCRLGGEVGPNGTNGRGVVR